MAGNKYLTYASGGEQLIAAAQTSAGVADAAKIVALDSTGKLDSTLMPAGYGEESDTFPTSENLTAGDFVNIYSNVGTATARKADASNGRIAHGFVLASVTSPANATVYRDGNNSQVTGKTIGAIQYLSVSTPGLTQETAPQVSGQTIQQVGVAKAANAISFKPQVAVTIA